MDLTESFLTESNLCFSDISAGIERDQWNEIG